MHSEDIEYTVDGRRYVGHLITDGRPGRRPGILIGHEGSGLDHNTKDKARQLAELGYCAYALDYHGDGRPLPPEEMMPRIGALRSDLSLARAIASTALDVLANSAFVDPDELAATGYCFGGTLALELARSGADVKAVVGFHSGLSTSRPQDAGNIRGKVLVCIGADDPLIPPSHRDEFEAEMRAGGVDWRMNLYGGAEHSFTNPRADGSRPGIKYHEPTDRRSWAAMRDLFDEVFGPR